MDIEMGVEMTVWNHGTSDPEETKPPLRPKPAGGNKSSIPETIEDLLKIPLAGGDIQDLADGIKEYAAQEANKAQVELWEKLKELAAQKDELVEYFYWDSGGNERTIDEATDKLLALFQKYNKEFVIPVSVIERYREGLHGTF